MQIQYIKMQKLKFARWQIFQRLDFIVPGQECLEGYFQPVAGPGEQETHSASVNLYRKCEIFRRFATMERNRE